MTRLLLALTLIAASPADAIEIWQCQMAESARAPWLGEGLVIADDREAGTAIVADAVMAAFNDGKPMRVRTGTSGKVVRLRWKVRNVRTDNGNLIGLLSYQATLDRANGAVRISANAPSYSLNLTRSGRCGQVSAAQQQEFLNFLNRAR